jgi:hypothetical protein
MSKSKEEIEALLINVDDLTEPITETRLSESQATAYNYLIDFLELEFYPSVESERLLILCVQVLEEFCRNNKQ